MIDAGISEKVDDETVTIGELNIMGNDAVVEELVPMLKRELPSLKRFISRRSAKVDDGNTVDYGLVANNDGALDSTHPQ